MVGTFKNSQLYLELRPQCPKCKKEFMMDLKKFQPGRTHICHCCGMVTQFDSQLAEHVQKLIHDFEASVCSVYTSIGSARME